MTSELKERVEKIGAHIARHRASTNRLLDHYIASLEEIDAQLVNARVLSPLNSNARKHIQTARRLTADLAKITRLWRGES